MFIVLKLLLAIIPDDGGVYGIEDGEAVTVTGTVDSVAAVSGLYGDEKQVYIRNIAIERTYGDRTDKPAHSAHREMVRAYMEEDVPVYIGQMVRIRGRVSCYEHATNPGQFDAYDYYRNRGALCDIYGAELIAAGHEYSRIKQGLYELRLKGEGILAKYLDETDAAVIKAMLFGNKTEIDRETKDMFKRNGIAHILAISGLHISFLAMLIYRLLCLVGLSVRARAVISEIMIVMYGVMVGFSASAFRAICMFTFFLIAKAIKRTYDMLTAMSLALTLVSITEPKMLNDTGLQLSYLAVLGVGYLCRRYSMNGPEASDRTGGKIRDKITDALKISFFVFLATLPAVLGAYGEAAFYSVLLNIVIIPFMSLLLSSSVALVLLGGAGIPGVPLLPAYIIKIILGLYKWLCTLLDSYGMGRTNVGAPGIWQTAVYYALLILAVNIPRKLSGKRSESASDKKEDPTVCDGKSISGWRCYVNRNFLASGLILVSAVMILFIHPLYGLNIWALDVGQGDCMVIRASDGIWDDGALYVIDCGSSDAKQVGDRRLIPMLKYYGFDRIDGVFISHPDADHYNGIEELVTEAAEENLEIGRIYVYEGFLGHENLQAISAMHELTGLHKGMKIRDGDLDIDVLYPYKGCQTEDTNEASLIMEISYRGFHMLTTGDATLGSEEHLDMDKLAEDEYSVLKVAHHGSSSSSGDDFLRVVRPTAALISCGRGNSYGHPHKETLDRLESVGSSVVRTDEEGAIMIYTDGRRMKIRTFAHGR